MEKKLTKHGNSVALILDKAILKLLKMDESTIVSLSITDNGLLITPAKKKKSASTKAKSESTLSTAKRIMKKHDTLFKKLAKT